MRNFWLFSLLVVLADAQLVLGATQAGHKDTENQEAIPFATQNATFRIPIKSWKTLRDTRIVKQDLDYSCGAASLVTLLNEFYGQ